jgi:hypothetical protein
MDMTVAGVFVDDPDSLDAAADLLESYGNWLAARADEYADEQGWTMDDWDEDGFHPCPAAADDPEPEPPSPAAPALRLVAQPTETPCIGCKGYGVVPMVPRTAHSGRPCWMCDGSGALGVPASTVADRTEHLRRIGQTGGLTTYALHGTNHFRRIGRLGYAVTVARHGQPYATALLARKGWTPRKPDLLSDLRAGRELADVANAA